MSSLSNVVGHAKSFTKTYASDVTSAWNRFWFEPRSGVTLSLMRIAVGAVVLYTHIVWAIGFDSFLNSTSLLPLGYRESLFGTSWAWSHFDVISGELLLWLAHWAGLLVILAFTLGWMTQWTSILTALIVISYANRATGALFGLDQINAFLCLYLAISNCGSHFSIDAKRRSPGFSETLVIRNNIATRLIQIHMCIVYFFAGIGKLQGETWWSGEAVWGALASYEYQTIDMTWMASFPVLIALLSLGTLFWEIAYPALIWPKLSRPIMLFLAIPIHLGIGLCMGMMTFGLIMLAGNMAFISTCWFECPISNSSESHNTP